MPLFGATTQFVLDKVAPISQGDLANFGYDSTRITELIEEKALLVFSYLPEKYRVLFNSRIYGIILEKRAFQGQTTVDIAIPATLSNFVCYKNPDIIDADKGLLVASNVSATYSAGVVTFSTELSAGDVIVADFSQSGMDSATIRELRWATISLCVGELLGIVSSEIETGNVAPFSSMQLEKTLKWLEAIKKNTRDRIVLKDLELEFWQSPNVLNRVSEFAYESTEGLS